eukprot:XP_011664373.1 PREDICTED: serine-threonine kinase receptor-associated protein-like [Strongylocentrotus purpuratus]
MSIAARQTAISCPGHTRPVVDLSFSEITLEHGYFMISACKDGQPMLRQGETGDWIGTFSGHKGAVWGAALNREAKLAATAAADFSAKVWDAVSGEALHDFSHKHIVKSVDFSSDSCKLLTASNEKLLRIFDLNAPEADPVVFSGHEDNIKHARFLPDERSIVSCSDDKTLRIWDIASNSEVRKIPLSSSNSSLDLVSDGSTLVVTHGKNISFYSADSLTLLSNSSYKGHFGPVHCVRFSPDGEMYASGSEDGTLRLWQTNIGKTYGLWKWIDDSEAEGVPVCNVANEAMSPPTVVKAES